MKLDRVSVCYLETRVGIQRLQFAGSVAKALGTKLSVLLPPVRSGENLSRESLALTETRIRGSHDFLEVEIEFLRVDPRSATVARTAIHIGDDTSIPGVILLRCFDETRLKDDGDHCIFIPFGKGGAGQRAARYGLALAKVLEMPVVFYHTTYPREGTVSTDPAMHVCSEAIDVRKYIEELAKAKTVRFTTVIEMAPTVEGGIVLSALNHNAALIVMSSGRQVLLGSYVDQVSKLGPVPLLVFFREVQ